MFVQQLFFSVLSSIYPCHPSLLSNNCLLRHFTSLRWWFYRLFSSVISALSSWKIEHAFSSILLLAALTMLLFEKSFSLYPIPSLWVTTIRAIIFLVIRTKLTGVTADVEATVTMETCSILTAMSGRVCEALLSVSTCNNIGECVGISRGTRIRRCQDSSMEGFRSAVFVPPWPLRWDPHGQPFEFGFKD